RAIAGGGRRTGGTRRRRPARRRDRVAAQRTLSPGACSAEREDLKPASGSRVLARQRAQRRGRLAEWMCLWHLRLRGWRIVARDWRCPSGEIDILARRGKVLAVIEVKSRGELVAAASALAPRQRRRIVRAAEAFLTQRSDLA